MIEKLADPKGTGYLSLLWSFADVDPGRCLALVPQTGEWAGLGYRVPGPGLGSITQTSS
jgi:hypothetical protein